MQIHILKILIIYILLRFNLSVNINYKKYIHKLFFNGYISIYLYIYFLKVYIKILLLSNTISILKAFINNFP